MSWASSITNIILVILNLSASLFLKRAKASLITSLACSKEPGLPKISKAKEWKVVILR